MMRRKLILGGVIFMLYAHSALGQTAADLAAKYGEPIRAYAVSEHIWMTPEYTIEGQVCEMRLHPRRIAADSNRLSELLPFEELKKVLDQLAPVDVRGAKKDSFGTTATGGGAAWTTYQYERVALVFTASFKVDLASQSKAKPYIFSEQRFPTDNKSEPTVNAQDDFDRSKTFRTKIVTIKWANRKCAGQ